MTCARARRGVTLALALAAGTAPPGRSARAAEAPACRYATDVRACAPQGCVPSGAEPDADPLMIEPGSPGTCAPCHNDRQCGGARCIAQTGLCSFPAPSPPPRPIWPHFHLAVAEASLNLADSGSSRPIAGAGYLFQGAFRSTHPHPATTGAGWQTDDLPLWYWNVGLTLAFAGPTQNGFADLGLTRYAPSLPFFMTTLSLGALAQRQGQAVWKGGASSSDRIGPALTVGLIETLFLRAAYLFPVRGPDDHGAVMLSAIYMKDLGNDLVPDRFRKFLMAPGN